MITDLDIAWEQQQDWLETSASLVWVIDGDCLYDTVIKKEYENMFRNYDEVLDVSEEYNESQDIVVRFIKNNEIINDFKTSEYFGSILLSNPTVLELLDYPYGRYVVSPNARFDGEKFIVLDMDTTHLLKWYPWQGKNEE